MLSNHKEDSRSQYGFLDEAGDVGHSEGLSHYLVVAILAVQTIEDKIVSMQEQ
jgi:hypothetical protein